MKVSNGSLTSSASSRFGQFSIQKTVDPNGEKVCSYNKRTFFSWTVHCLRFRFSKAYRQNVIAERLEILNALDKSRPGQTFSASHDSSDDIYDSSENMQPVNVTLSSRRQFNSRVSELLRGYKVSVEPGEPQATAAQLNLLYKLGDGRDRTDRVLRSQEGVSGSHVMRHECTAPPYVLQFVEDALEAGYAANAPNPNGSDKNGELCKYFLTYHMFTSDKVGAKEENLFKWEAVSSKFDPSKAYPMIAPANLPGEGWKLRVPSDRSIKYAAQIANTVREIGSSQATIFINQKVLAKEDDGEEWYIAKQFLAFMFEGLGNDLQAQDYEISQGSEI